MSGKRTFGLALLFSVSLGAAPLARGSAADGTVLPLPPEDQQELTARLGPGVVGQALPSVPITDVSVYFPLQERAATYQVTAGKNAGKVQQLSVGKGNRPNGSVAWKVGLSPFGGERLRRRRDRHYHPAQPVPAQRPQAGRNAHVLANGGGELPRRPDVARLLGNPERQVHLCGYVPGDCVPAGTYQAILARLAYEGKVGPAHTTDTAYYLFAPHVGVVAMVTQEDVEAYWIIHIDSKSGKVADVHQLMQRHA